MKKLIPLILVVVVLGLWIFMSRQSPSTVAVNSNPQATAAATQVSGSTSAKLPPPLDSSNLSTSLTPGAVTGNDEEEGEDVDVKPAAEVFTSAQDAFKAVKDGAADYNDTILEQFTQPGDDCTWCPEFYKMVNDSLNASDTTQDQKSYFAEILAISGKVDNVKSLVDKIENAKTTEEADLYSEALELTVGKDDVTDYLGKELDSKNQSLREASVAAITNQGSRLAAELLIKNTEDRGDPDGYYSLGMGLGEFIPDEDAIPAIQQFVEKRNQYAHLGVKALVNSGMNGLRIVFDVLENSKDPEADRKNLLKDMRDHVNFEDGLEAFLNDRKANTKQPLVREVAQQILDELNSQAESDVEVSASTTEQP